MFCLEREYVADTILDREVLDWLSKNQLTLNLTLEKLGPKYSHLSIRTKVNININQENSK